MLEPGYWLNPNTDKIIRVPRTHDEWLLNPENVKSIGLGEPTIRKIETLKPNWPRANVDEIRMAGLEGGLVRIRDHSSRISIQFMAERQRVRSILWSIVVALLGTVKTHPDTFLTIDNLSLRDSVSLTLGDLKNKLRDEQTVMMEEKGVVQDIPMSYLILRASGYLD